jgi:peptide deformylase
MVAKPILLLGHPDLYKVSEQIAKDELDGLRVVIQDLHDTLMDFRAKYGAGRAIAAPQIGVAKRLVYMHVDTPVVIMNPEFTYRSTEMFELWDDCMSFPELLVKVRRHKECRIRYRDARWNLQETTYSGDLSELVQHEYDHLDGVLAVDRAIDLRSFRYRSVHPKNSPNES